MRKLDLEQGTQEWLDARDKYRSASEAAVVMGISPFNTPEKLKMIKAGLTRQYVNAAMRRGHDLEDQVRRKVGLAMDKDFVPECWQRGDYMASLDGIDGDTVLEIKVSARTYADIEADNLPRYYLTQINIQLFCSPGTVAYLAAMHPETGDIAISPPIEFDQGMMEEIDRAFEAFDRMPVPDLPMNATGENHITALFEDLRLYRDQIAELKKLEAAAKAALIGYSPPRGIHCGDHKLTPRKGAVRIDYKALLADHPEIDTEPYKREGEGTWAVTLGRGPFDV